MTHEKLVTIAARWLRNYTRMSVVTTETRALTDHGEIPDAIGFCSEYSILVECKTSRADFAADASKVFRKDPSLGMGSFRFYLAPEGLLKPEDLPPRWGLVEVGKRNKCHLTLGPKGNIWMTNGKAFYFPERNIKAELELAISLLRRK